MLKRYLWMALLIGLHAVKGHGQSNPDSIYQNSIHTVLIHPVNKPLAIPVVPLNEFSPLLISFDDFKNDYQDYYYSVELRNADWSAVPMSAFDYLQGFNQNRITQYSISSIAIQRYYHYKFTFPNSNCRPTKSGNYIIKVYKDSNPQQIVFTSRFFVVDDQVSILSSIQEPFDGNISKTHQKVQLSVETKKLSFFQPDQIQVQVIQNYRYNDALRVNTPNFVRGSLLEYNSERDLIFPSGKELRWLDLQSFRLKSDRILNFEATANGTIVNVKPDFSRATTPYFIFKDINGQFLISNSESIDSDNQNDYATVVFTYVPPNRLPLIGETLYLSGSLTNNMLDETAEMKFNAVTRAYQKSLLLKQGYYSYSYILRDKAAPDPMLDFNETEGDHWETENAYSVFIYYRPPGARHDHLIGFTTIHSNQY